MRWIAMGESPPVEFGANDRTYNYDYYLANNIYPRWQKFVKPVHKTQGKKQLGFHNAQVAARKDVERTFGILKAIFAIVRRPVMFWDQ
jgi:DNA polymerase elongation subunit (family B)